MSRYDYGIFGFSTFSAIISLFMGEGVAMVLFLIIAAQTARILWFKP